MSMHTCIYMCNFNKLYNMYSLERMSQVCVSKKFVQHIRTLKLICAIAIA